VPFEPVPLSDIVIVPTLLPWASFICTTVLAALASDQKIIANVTAATKNRLSFMAQIITKLRAARHFLTTRAKRILGYFGAGFA
jgi:hypothetical protein